jgi:hypothetical protein
MHLQKNLVEYLCREPNYWARRPISHRPTTTQLSPFYKLSAPPTRNPISLPLPIPSVLPPPAPADPLFASPLGRRSAAASFPLLLPASTTSLPLPQPPPSPVRPAGPSFLPSLLCPPLIGGEEQRRGEVQWRHIRRHGSASYPQRWHSGPSPTR